MLDQANEGDHESSKGLWLDHLQKVLLALNNYSKGFAAEERNMCIFNSI